MNEQEYKKQIVEYYDEAEVDYKLMWDLNHSQAMHYGYWDKKSVTPRQALVRENEILAEKARIRREDIVLDAGCGVGGSSIFLAKKYNCKVVGITLSKKQKDTADQNAKKQGVSKLVEFKVMDYENMTFPEGTFDVVWGIESVCHALNKQKFLENVYMVLKPSGRLIIADFFSTKDNYYGSEKDIMQKWLSGWAVHSLETKEKFENLLSAVGLKKISFIDTTKNIMPSARYLYVCSFPAIVVDRVLQFLKLRNKVQMMDVIAARYQYKTLQKGLWKYGIFYAEK